MANFLEAFPDKAGLVAQDVNLTTVHDGFGLLVAQNGNDLHEVFVHTALSPRPQDGFVTVTLDAQAARNVAKHLLHLAKYAELGVEAERPDE